MITSARVAVFGGAELRASVVALGLEPVQEGAQLAVIDARDPAATRDAAALRSTVPRVVMVADRDRDLVAALGMDITRVVTSIEPAILGPVLSALIPAPARMATRIVFVTSARGGVGRTMLAVSLALRLTPQLRACVVDATGCGAASWWLRCEPRPWSELEGLVDEMTADHLSVMAEDAGPGLRVVGGTSVAPSAALLAATIRAATSLDDLVIVDAPLITDAVFRASAALAHRVLVLAYDDPWSRRLLASAGRDDDWLIASQANVATIGDLPVFRCLPRDESAVSAAVAARSPVRGSLGKAYDDLADILLVDAT